MLGLDSYSCFHSRFHSHFLHLLAQHTTSIYRIIMIDVYINGLFVFFAQVY